MLEKISTHYNNMYDTHICLNFNMNFGRKLVMQGYASRKR